MSRIMGWSMRQYDPWKPRNVPWWRAIVFTTYAFLAGSWVVVLNSIYRHRLDMKTVGVWLVVCLGYGAWEWWASIQYRKRTPPPD